MANYIKNPTQALAYSRFRPTTPQKLVNSIVEFLKKQSPTDGRFGLALDVGCGSGQGTGSLAPFFDKVIGVDSSREQLQYAIENNTHPNVTYRLGPAERLEEAAASVDLVAAGMAAHWFDLPRFYSEAGRVLRSRGAVALYGHGMPRPVTGDKSCRAIEMIKSTLGKFIPDESRLVYFEEYKGQQFAKCPFSKAAAVRLEFKSQIENATVGDFVGYVSTMSGYQNFKIKHGEESGLVFLKELEEMLVQQIAKRDGQVTIMFPYFLLLSSKDI